MPSFLSLPFQSLLGTVSILLVNIHNVSAAIGDPINCAGLLWSSVIDIYPKVPMRALDVCTRALDDRGINRGLDGVCGLVDTGGYSSVIFSTFPEVDESTVEIGATWAAFEAFAPWVALFCRDNCWCTTDAFGHGRNKPKGYSAYNQILPEPLQRIYQFDLEEGPRYESLRNRRLQLSGSQTLALRTYIQPFKYSRIAGSIEFEKTLLPAIPVALDPLNIIECNREPLPDFPNMPGPYTGIDFGIPIRLCATALSGGNPGANAGGFCRRTSSIPNSGSGGHESMHFGGDVSFNRLFTPRREFTVPTSDFVAQLHYECWKRCWCKNYPNRPREGRSKWILSKEETLVKETDNSIHLIYKHHDTTMDIKVSDTASIGEDRKTSYPTPWCFPYSDGTCNIQEEADAIAKDSSYLPFPSPSKLRITGLPMCGHTCKGPEDCSGSDAVEGCHCTVVDSSIARLVGIVPILPVALCLVLPQMGAFLRTKGWSALTDLPKHRRRDPDDDDETRGARSWTCHCNATFVSEACCETGHEFL